MVKVITITIKESEATLEEKAASVTKMLYDVKASEVSWHVDNPNPQERKSCQAEWNALRRLGD